jgi:Ca-activated chloride channel homolog
MKIYATKFWQLTLGLTVLSLLAPQTLQAKQLQLNVAMANPSMVQGTEGKATNFVRIGLTGFELPAEKDRMPVNVTIVIDKSGSMQGEKIEQARNAAIQAVDRLRDSDIVSIVTYDSSVTVLVPATKASDRESIKAKISSISPSGNTALFAGVSKGAAEVRKFLDEQRVNRVILLSDGLANVGPKSPAELEQLGESLIKEGISVSTMGLGLGYNEDLMSRLALASSGNHVFIENAENLVEVFQSEFDDVLSVVAQKIRIEAQLAEGVRPVKVLNYPADITGQKVSIDLGQLYSSQERYFVVEVEVPLRETGQQSPVAEVAVEYVNMVTETTDKLTSAVQVKFTETQEIADQDIDKQIYASCVIQIANEKNRMATDLRDAGKVEEARKLLLGNSDYLRVCFEQLGIEELNVRCELNAFQAQNLEGKDWGINRKAMREAQNVDAVQQSYGGSGQKTDFKKSK